MKIFEYSKIDDKRTFKFFGLTLMEKTLEYESQTRRQKFFGGLVSTEKKIDLKNNYYIKDFKLLGKSIAKRTEENATYNYFIFEKNIYSISYNTQFKKKYFKYFDKKHDDIYVLQSNSGETFLILTYVINSLLKKNKSKNPLLVATQKKQIELIKMICPHIPYVYIGRLYIEFKYNYFNIDNRNVYLLFTKSHFQQVNENIKRNTSNENHYFKQILSRLNINENEIEMNKISISSEIENSMLQKISKYKLNLDNFIFIAPDARSCELINQSFWQDLINSFKEKGFDVFVNTCDLNLSEAFLLAKKAKKIITLRSGLAEILLQTNTPMDIIYTNFRTPNKKIDLSDKEVLAGFSLKNLPFINNSNIQEYTLSDTNKENIIKTGVI